MVKRRTDNNLLINEPVKLIAVDMDGTLLRSDKTVDPQTAADIQIAADRGVQIAYCTGRGLAEMGDIFRALPFVRYAVLSSGAVIYDHAEDRILFHDGIGHPLIDQITAVAARFSAMPHFLTDWESIAAAEDMTHMADFHMGAYQPLYQQIARGVADMKDEGKRLSEVVKLNIYFRTAADQNEAFALLEKLPVQVTRSENTILEMTALSVNKGSGLKFLAESLNIPLARTAAIGDNYNDVDMLNASGFPIAMGNAIDPIKALCAFTTADNDHNGVGQAIRFILEKMSAA